MNLPDPAPVIDLIEAFRRSKTMFTAVGMGVFDLLHERPADASAVARHIGGDPDATARLLDGCAALGLLRKEGGVYANQPVAEVYLCAASRHTLRGYVRYSDEALYPMWGNLEDAVREGAPRWNQTFGVEGGIFSGFFRTDEAKRDFLQAMHGFGLQTSPAVAAAFDLQRFRTVVDLGGATGHLAVAICERYPEIRGIVFDLPQAVPAAREYIAQSLAAGRIRVVEGDFFRDELPEADLYALGRILHDWPESRIKLLLDRIYDRLPAGGGVLIAEWLLNEDGVGPVSANMQSLNMLVCAEGRERTASDYERLLRASGFAEVRARRTGKTLDAVLGIRA